MKSRLHVILLHEHMNDKTGTEVTTSLTMIDTHDISRSAQTYGADSIFFAHPSPALRKLARKLQNHWQDGYGAEYNPDRKEALTNMHLVTSIDEAISSIEKRYENLPKLIATSALPGKERISFSDMRKTLENSEDDYMLMFGTGWGMADSLLDRADYFIEPVNGVGDYNHLSVRSACAIILDRLRGAR